MPDVLNSKTILLYLKFALHAMIHHDSGWLGYLAFLAASRGVALGMVLDNAMPLHIAVASRWATIEESLI